MRTRLLSILSACVSAVCLEAASPSPARVWAQEPMRSESGIGYLSGGIGLEEREALRAVAPAYTLLLSFADRTGHYLSDVEVVISDAAGNTLLEAVSHGPWFWVQLPPGTYTVVATTAGIARRQVAQVGAARQTQLYFSW